MSATRPDFCDGCHKPIVTSHPFNLCPDCDLRRETQRARERAWKRTPLSKRAAVRVLEAAAILCGFICCSLALWILEPSFNRLVTHLWPLLVLGRMLFLIPESQRTEKDNYRFRADTHLVSAAHKALSAQVLCEIRQTYTLLLDLRSCIGPPRNFPDQFCAT